VVLRDVPADCTVVGVPGRIIYRSGVRVDPLEHGNLPDSEATVIRTLVDRIEALEQQLQELQEQVNPPSSIPVLVHAGSSKFELPTSPATATVPQSCNLKDKMIQEFFDGSGI
jgi:serine O-acetyltransferase